MPRRGHGYRFSQARTADQRRLDTEEFEQQGEETGERTEQRRHRIFSASHEIEGVDLDDFSDSMSEKSIAEGDVYLKKRKKYKLPPVGKGVPEAYKK